jgi:leucyl-tRNA synthetase
MEFVNAWREEGVVLSRSHLEMFASMLSLFAPKTAEEIGVGVGWPDASSIAGLDKIMVKVAVQVNGKMRAIIEVENEKSKIQSEIVALALSDERVKKWISGEVKKTVFIPGKMLSLVV